MVFKKRSDGTENRPTRYKTIKASDGRRTENEMVDNERFKIDTERGNLISPTLKNSDIVIKQVEDENPKDTLMEQLEFTNGENKITIHFIKKHNRMFRMQIFLNNELEIRPTTFTGLSPAMTFWGLLKNSLKKKEEKNEKSYD